MTIRDGALEVDLEAEAEASKAAWLNTELVKAGIAVSELRPIERDLEQVFFELTGEGTDHVG